MKSKRNRAGLTRQGAAQQGYEEYWRSVYQRLPPESFLGEQLTGIVGISRDVLYFRANRHSPDVKAAVEKIEDVYPALGRKSLGLERA